jgi:hypothetical protein
MSTVNTSKENNLEWVLCNTEWIIEKVRADKSYSQNLYAALCKNYFVREENIFDLLKEKYWACSWRRAGGIVANMLDEGDYIDWYCSGMGGLNAEYVLNETEMQWKSRTGYVTEGTVTEEIGHDLRRLGWIVIRDDINK